MKTSVNLDHIGPYNPVRGVTIILCLMYNKVDFMPVRILKQFLCVLAQETAHQTNPHNSCASAHACRSPYAYPKHKKSLSGDPNRLFMYLITKP